MDIQLSILQFLQSIRNPVLNILFLGLTISTELPIVVLFISIVYWCLNKKYGQKLLFTIIGNVVVNIGIKQFVKAPRPIGTNGLEAMRVSTATGYSFPSGHTQIATTFWTSLIIILKKNWMYILGSVAIIGVGISRMYLGVHWPIDVLFGWIFGLLFTIIISKVFDIVDENENYFILIIMLMLFGSVIFILNSTEYVKMLGLFTGLVLGYIVENKFIQFNTSNITFKINLYRFIIGILSLGVLYIALKFIIPSTVVFDYIRYTIVVFYAVAGVPALFKLLDLN